MNYKRLLGFLLVLGVIILALVYYHKTTPSPYDSEAFFGAGLHAPIEGESKHI